MALGLIILFIQPQSLAQNIEVDIQNQSFSGSLAALVICLAILFFWMGLREKEKDKLNATVDALNKATAKLQGRMTNLVIRFEPDELVPELQRIIESSNFDAEYFIKRRGQVVKSGKFRPYKHPEVNAVMADIEDIPATEELFLEIVLKADGKTWRASESVRVRRINLELEV